MCCECEDKTYSGKHKGFIYNNHEYLRDFCQGRGIAHAKLALKHFRDTSRLIYIAGSEYIEGEIPCIECNDEVFFGGEPEIEYAERDIWDKACDRYHENKDMELERA